MSETVPTKDGRIHLFGDEQEWAISEYDGCLRFHPNVLEFPDSCSEWVWREAWQEVDRLGGYDAVVEKLRNAAG